MLTTRYLIRLAYAFIKRFKAILAIGIIFGIASFFFFRFIGPSIWGAKVERIGVTGRFRSDTLPDFILEMIGNGLTKINQKGEVEPNLASSWETPDKGKTWIFTLKEDIYWQDGGRITSETINYDFTDVEIERPDKKTIVFKLQNPFSPFPAVVSKPTFKKGLLGNGEWRVTKASVVGRFMQTLVLVNEKKEKKIIKFYPTEERTKLSFKLGEVDTLLGIFNPTPFDTWETAFLEEEQNRSQYVAVFFNTEDENLSEKNIRQALAYAIDKENLDGQRAISPISPDSWGYNPQVKIYAYSRERTEELLGDLPEEARENLSIKLVTSPTLLPVAEKIAKFWQEIGIQAIVQVSSSVPSEYQALLTIFDIPSDPDQYSIWHSTQEGTNISKYKNPRIDKLLEDGRLELDFEERRKIYLDFQRFLVEDSPAAFLYHPKSFKIVRK